MTATNHGLMGALIATQLLPTRPVLAVATSFGSHFLLDALPHYGDAKLSLHSRRFYRQLTVDAVLAVIVTLILAGVYSELWWLVILCASVAASPDLAWYYYCYYRPKASLDPLSRFHSVIQWSQTVPGLLAEGIFFVSIGMYLLVSS